MADIIQFPDNEWSKDKELEQAWMEQSENFTASLAEALRIRDVQPYINQHKPVWETEGNILKRLRMARGLLVAHVAGGIGVSPGRIKRLEAGEPVNDAMLLKKAYMLFLTHQSATSHTGVTQQ